jgi:hypothetical protein
MPGRVAPRPIRVFWRVKRLLYRSYATTRLLQTPDRLIARGFGDRAGGQTRLGAPPAVSHAQRDVLIDDAPKW